VRRLAAAWGRIRSIHGLGRDMAVLAALVLAGSGVGGYILVNQRIVFPWQERVPFRADFEEVPGIRTGTQEVRIAGVMVGDISRAEVTREGRARITLSLKKEYAEVYENARAYLRPKTSLNDMYVLLDPGRPPARRLRPGEVIPLAQTARPIQADEVLEHFDERTRNALGVALAESDAALARAEVVPGGMKATDAALAALRPLAEALEVRREHVASLITALADIATAAGQDDARLAHLLDSTRETLSALAARDAELDATLAALPGFSADLGRSSAAVSALSAELDPALDGIRAASGRLPQGLAGLIDVTNRFDATMDLARPVVSEARPLVADLRPLVDSSRAALTDTVAWSHRFDPMTANLVAHLPDVSNFIYYGNSATHLEDANGPILRGLNVFGSQGFCSLVNLPGVTCP
jgi:phospholipid/cholesterol/gamma-HCH transport system substrate-binding protein